MSNPKFTPGPWIAVSRGCFGGTHEADVHECAKWDVDIDDGEFMRGNFRMEDAHLIATAPELYAALNRLIQSMDLDPKGGWSGAIIDAKNALAKARGE